MSQRRHNPKKRSSRGHSYRKGGQPIRALKFGRTVIELYPETPRPIWLKNGVKVFCRGEAQEVFTVFDMDERTCSSMLLTLDGRAHGRESWAKLSNAS